MRKKSEKNAKTREIRPSCGPAPWWPRIIKIRRTNPRIFSIFSEKIIPKIQRMKFDILFECRKRNMIPFQLTFLNCYVSIFYGSKKLEALFRYIRSPLLKANALVSIWSKTLFETVLLPVVAETSSSLKVLKLSSIPAAVSVNLRTSLLLIFLLLSQLSEYLQFGFSTWN